MFSCPFCTSLCTVPIVYGKPGPALERASKRGLVEIGGCVIDSPGPHRRCLDCSKAWPERYKAPEYEFISTAVVMVQKLQDAVSSAVSSYGAACVRYGREAERRGPVEHHSYLAMMQAHRGISDEWARFYVMAQDYCSRYSGVENSRVYGHFYWPISDE